MMKIKATLNNVLVGASIEVDGPEDFRSKYTSLQTLYPGCVVQFLVVKEEKGWEKIVKLQPILDEFDKGWKEVMLASKKEVV